MTHPKEKFFTTWSHWSKEGTQGQSSSEAAGPLEAKDRVKIQAPAQRLNDIMIYHP